MTATEYVSVVDSGIRSYVQDMSRALEPRDRFTRDYLETEALVRISTLPGDVDRKTILRSVASIMLQRTTGGRKDLRRAKSVIKKYVS